MWFDVFKGYLVSVGVDAEGNIHLVFRCPDKDKTVMLVKALKAFKGRLFTVKFNLSG